MMTAKKTLPKLTVVPPVTTPMDMIAQAVSTGADVQVLEKLMNLQERWAANQARVAFDLAISDARKELPAVIKKDASVSFGSGNKTAYDHETLGEIKKTVDPILSKHGIDYRWSSRQEGTTLFITCVLSHKEGHREETTLSAPNDTSGSKNPIQAVGSSATYLQRYTLKLALGLAAGKDDDAQAATNGNEAITDQQCAELIALAEEVGADKARFCNVVGIEGFAEIKMKDFEAAKALLEKKRGK